MSLGTNIHHVSGHCRKGSQGQRSKVKVVTMAEAGISTVWLHTENTKFSSFDITILFIIYLLSFDITILFIIHLLVTATTSLLQPSRSCSCLDCLSIGWFVFQHFFQ